MTPVATLFETGAVTHLTSEFDLSRVRVDGPRHARLDEPEDGVADRNSHAVTPVTAPPVAPSVRDTERDGERDTEPPVTPADATGETPDETAPEDVTPVVDREAVTPDDRNTDRDSEDDTVRNSSTVTADDGSPDPAEAVDPATVAPPVADPEPSVVGADDDTDRPVARPIAVEYVPSSPAATPEPTSAALLPLVAQWRSGRARRRAERAFALDMETDAQRRRHVLTETIEAARERVDEVITDLTLAMRVLVGFVAAVVLTVTAVMGVVIIGTQIAYYEGAMKVTQVSFAGLGISRPLDLPTFTPIATESVVWACTLMAVVLVLLNRTAGLWLRAMWLFASIEAFVNSFHAIADDNDFLGGVVKGGLSIAAPFVVHLFVLWTKHLRSGKTYTQARVDTAIRWRALGQALLALVLTVANHVVHPRTALAAFSIWIDNRQATGVTYQQALYIASKPRREKIAKTYGIDLGDQGTLGLVLAPAAPAAAEVVGQSGRQQVERQSGRLRRGRHAMRAAQPQQPVDQKPAARQPEQPARSTAPVPADVVTPASQERPDQPDDLGEDTAFAERREVPPPSPMETTQPLLHSVGGIAETTLTYILTELKAGRTPSKQRIIDETGIEPATLRTYLGRWQKGRNPKLTSEQVELIKAA